MHITILNDFLNTSLDASDIYIKIKGRKIVMWHSDNKCSREGRQVMTKGREAVSL
jgi:hypothetical protein